MSPFAFLLASVVGTFAVIVGLAGGNSLAAWTCCAAGAVLLGLVIGDALR